MIRSTLRWSLVVACLVIVGPLAAQLLGTLRDADGGRATSILVNAAPLTGLATTALIVVAAGLIGALGARAFTTYTGLACAGVVIAWARWGVGTTEDLIRRAGDGRDLTMLSVEAAITGVLTLAAGLLIARQGRGAASRPHAKGFWGLFVEPGDGPPPAQVAGASLLAAIVVGGLTTWLIAASGVRGQTMMAGVVGGIAAGVGAQLASHAMNSHATIGPGLVAMLLLGVASPIVARVMHGPRLLEIMFAGDIFPPARLLSLDWSSGALLGVPLGMIWAGAMPDPRAAALENA